MASNSGTPTSPSKTGSKRLRSNTDDTGMSDPEDIDKLLEDSPESKRPAHDRSLMASMITEMKNVIRTEFLPSVNSLRAEFAELKKNERHSPYQQQNNNSNHHNSNNNDVEMEDEVEIVGSQGPGTSGTSGATSNSKTRGRGGANGNNTGNSNHRGRGGGGRGRGRGHSHSQDRNSNSNSNRKSNSNPRGHSGGRRGSSSSSHDGRQNNGGRSGRGGGSQNNHSGKKNDNQNGQSKGRGRSDHDSVSSMTVGEMRRMFTNICNNSNNQASKAKAFADKEVILIGFEKTEDDITLAYNKLLIVDPRISKSDIQFVTRFSKEDESGHPPLKVVLKKKSVAERIVENVETSENDINWVRRGLTWNQRLANGRIRSDRERLNSNLPEDADYSWEMNMVGGHLSLYQDWTTTNSSTETTSTLSSVTSVEAQTALKLLDEAVASSSPASTIQANGTTSSGTTENGPAAAASSTTSKPPPKPPQMKKKNSSMTDEQKRREIKRLQAELLGKPVLTRAAKNGNSQHLEQQPPQE